MQPNPEIRLLLIDDDEDEFIITRDLLSECDGSRFDLEWVSNYEDGLAAIKQARHDVYLVDYRLGERHGVELLREAMAAGCKAPIIMLTGQGDKALDIEAMKSGASDFLVKGQLSASLLERAIRYARERAHSVEALKLSEERYRVLFDSNPQPMWVYDRETLAILTVNDAAIVHYGYTRAEFLAMTIRDLHLPDQQHALLEAVSNHTGVLRRPGVWKQKKKNGDFIDVEITTHELLFDSRPARLVLANDVTERLNLETQLRQAQKMESVGQLAAGVAHDFNNILTVVQGQASLLLAERDLPAQMQESLGQIGTAAERASNLTRQLLTFSRRQIMQLRVLAINEAVNNVAKMLRRLLGDNIELEMRMAPDLPPIYADLGMVEQIIVNLSVNSRDAMPEGGRLVISTKAVDIDKSCSQNHSEAKLGRYVCLSVEDTGCGMDAQTLSRIFEPFFTTKEVGKGTGLGLATVYGIAKQHLGWVEVNSQVGCGTAFKVFLPSCDRPVEKSIEDHASTVVTRGTERVLVVEDEPDVRYLVQHVLENHGYRVLTARSGVEALKVWERQNGQIQLLLTDMVMPDGVSGRELGTRLQSEDPKLKVMYTSGYSVDLVGRDFELRDGQNFLQKPYRPNKLAQAVRQCLDSGKSELKTVVVAS